MRTFIAIKVTPEPKLRDVISCLKNQLAGELMKWVDEEKLHLTLKFLGDTSTEQVEQVKKELAGIARQVKPVSIIPVGPGYFKSRGMPNVLFIKIAGGEKLNQIAGIIDKKLVPLGFEAEKRLFAPHLTLARIKFIRNKQAFYQAIENYKPPGLMPVEVTEIYFYQSILNPAGPSYHELGIYPFTGDSIKNN